MSKPTYVAIYICDRCKEEIQPIEANAMFGNYGTNANGDKHCYPCCGARDREYMISNGKITLYLSSSPNPNYTGLGTMGNQHKQLWTVTNWPNSLRFSVVRPPKRSWHNIARNRYDVWFNGPDGLVWWGVQYGDMTQLCHCKRTRRLWRMPQDTVATYGLERIDR